MPKYDKGLLMKVAEMSYYQGMSQKEISSALGISPASVCRLIKEGFESGIIKVEIRNDSDYFEELEEKVRKQYGLAEVALVGVPAKAGDAQLKKYLGQKAKGIFTSLLSPECNVGIGVGVTIAEMVASLKVGEVPYNINPYPLVGGWSNTRLFGESSNILQNLSSSLGCSFNALLAPGVFANKDTRAMMLEEPEVRKVTDMWDRLDMAVFVVGPSLKYSEHREIYPPYLQEKSSGDILGWPIDRQDGSLVEADSNGRLMSIPLDKLLRIPVRIGIGGGKAKCENIISALRGGYITHLVTDYDTAKFIAGEV